jgi:hypothetical protein
MTEDPEEVLPQQRIGAGRRVEEVGVEESIEGEQEQRDRDDRHGEHEQELDDEHHPGEHRHAEHRHAGTAEIDDGDDEVDGTHQRCEAGDLEAQGVEVDAMTGREGQPTVGRVVEPTTIGAAAEDPRRVQEDATGEKHPKAQRVEARERDVARTDLQRYQIVGERGGNGIARGRSS